VQTERGLRAVGATARQVELDFAADARAPDLTREGTQNGVRGDGAGRPAGAEQSHGPRRRVDEHRVVVAVEHHHADAQ
jgi:hypothetical protein